jgi:exonuclease SbcC
MKPLKLTFKGINSFSEKAEIDFATLTSGGLFGIFGDTGSGKSTILDSINFALYGDVDRSKKKTDIINYDCDSAEVTFVFDILTCGERKTYTIERSIKKKSGLGKAMLYVGEGENSECIADNTTSVNTAIEDILGLTAEDFRKCIALPQGEFSQFVKCVPSERFKLIERLFDLYKYGDRLKERLSERENAVNGELFTVEGELSAYSQVSAEQEELYKNQLKADAEELENLTRLAAESKAEHERVSKLYDNALLLEQTKNRLAELESGRENIEQLKKSVKLIPVCRAVTQKHSEIEQRKNQLAAVCLSEHKTEEALSLAEEECAKLELQIKSADYESKLIAEREKLASFTAATDKCKELAAVKQRYNKLKSDYLRLSDEGKKLKAKNDEQQKKTEAAKKAYDECSKADVRDFFDNQFKHSVLRSEYEKQIVYFGDLRESIKIFGKSDIYDFLYEELTSRIKYYEGLILNCVGEKIDIDKKIKELQAASDKRERLADILNDCKTKLAECSKNIMINAREAELVKTQGKEAGERIAELEKGLACVFGDGVTDYDGAIFLQKRKIDSLKAESDKLTLLLQDKKAKVEKLKISAAELKSQRISYASEIDEQTKNLNELFAQSGFNSVDECIALIKSAGDENSAEKKIAEYDGSVVALNEQLNRLTALQGVEEVNKQVADAAKLKCEEYDRKLREKHADVKLAQSRLCELTEKLEQKKRIEVRHKAALRKKNLITQLKELTKSNKFMEYIAGEYLSEISAIASNTLLKLTDGRYFLTYTDNFYVGDNFNCGNLRGVNTLSGGETFLVSLSLALALSSVICAKSLRSIEFFFLDEGFGTLDENLIDTVMNSLEKLKSSSFTIGIISHVEELKHRIDNKIIVNKATESHGSTITIIH